MVAEKLFRGDPFYGDPGRDRGLYFKCDTIAFHRAFSQRQSPLFPQAKPDDPKFAERKPRGAFLRTSEEPPEEDVTMKPKEYTFNPLQAEKEAKIGDYYFKKGSFRAAAGRFEEATKWNPGMADAYFKLGEAKEKMKDKKSARLAFQKYLELEPDGKRSPSREEGARRQVTGASAATSSVCAPRPRFVSLLFPNPGKEIYIVECVPRCAGVRHRVRGAWGSGKSRLSGLRMRSRLHTGVPHETCRVWTWSCARNRR